MKCQYCGNNRGKYRGNLVNWELWLCDDCTTPFQEAMQKNLTGKLVRRDCAFYGPSRCEALSVMDCQTCNFYKSEVS